MLALCMMLLVAYYAYYYAGIIGRGLNLVVFITGIIVSLKTTDRLINTYNNP